MLCQDVHQYQRNVFLILMLQDFGQTKMKTTIPTTHVKEQIIMCQLKINKIVLDIIMGKLLRLITDHNHPGFAKTECGKHCGNAKVRFAFCLTAYMCTKGSYNQQKREIT